jgi:hypothetical protein
MSASFLEPGVSEPSPGHRKFTSVWGMSALIQGTSWDHNEPQETVELSECIALSPTSLLQWVIRHGPTLPLRGLCGYYVDVESS